MRLTSADALASRQALNRNASAAIALVGCSATLDSWSRPVEAHIQPHELLGHGQQAGALRTLEAHTTPFDGGEMLGDHLLRSVRSQEAVHTCDIRIVFARSLRYVTDADRIPLVHEKAGDR